MSAFTALRHQCCHAQSAMLAYGYAVAELFLARIQRPICPHLMEIVLILLMVEDGITRPAAFQFLQDLDSHVQTD